MPRAALVVEDDVLAAKVLTEMLRRRGFEPTVFTEGSPAVPWVRENKPEFVLLDLMLPDVDGFTVCENLKLDRDTNLLPIIMVTALTEHKDMVRGLQVGANRYVTKPFTSEQLYKAIDEALAWKEDLVRRGTSGEVHFQLQSDVEYLEELNHLLSALFLYGGLPEDQAKQLAMAVREMGVNAIEWGHRKEVERIVTVTYRIDHDKVTILIRDTGPGFNPTTLAHAAKPNDPIGHMMVREALGLREGGFGILLARGLVDDLQYNETGNEVRLVKHFPRADRDVSVPSVAR